MKMKMAFHCICSRHASVTQNYLSRVSVIIRRETTGKERVETVGKDKSKMANASALVTAESVVRVSVDSIGTGLTGVIPPKMLNHRLRCELLQRCK